MRTSEICEIPEICEKSRIASQSLMIASSAVRNNVLETISKKMREPDFVQKILERNAIDMKNAKLNGVRDTMTDRLLLNESRIIKIADALIKIINLPDPIGTGEFWTRPNGLNIRRMRVPIGVCGIIYESRPNVTVDAAALCIKSGNAVILRGGKEAINTNISLADIIRQSAAEAGLDENIVQIIKDTSRESANILMRQHGKIDVLIPRGGASLIKSVVENSTVPVIETGAGNCHIYVDDTADFEMAANVIRNAKTRPSVCNSVETVIVSSAIYNEFLPLLYDKLSDMGTSGVEFRGCSRTVKAVSRAKEATEDDYYTEYNDFILAVKVVDTLGEAIAHINKYNTGHSEAIITKDISRAREFQNKVDAAAVYANASTWFTDGEEFGFGAEIGIATSKLHARGPMGLNALTTIKYLIDGDGTTR